MAYDAAAPLLKEFLHTLEKNIENPSMLSLEPSYGEFVWVALMVFPQIVDNGIVEALLEYSGFDKPLDKSSPLKVPIQPCFSNRPITHVYRHHTTDKLCWYWCEPPVCTIHRSPINGSRRAAG